MRKLTNLFYGAVVAAVLVAPVAWADARNIAQPVMVAHDVLTLPVVWQSAVAVVRSVSFFTP